MITILVLAIAIVSIVVALALIIGVGGTAFLAVFGDLIIAVLVIWLIVKLIRRNKK